MNALHQELIQIGNRILSISRSELYLRCPGRRQFQIVIHLDFAAEETVFILADSLERPCEVNRDHRPIGEHITLAEGAARHGLVPGEPGGEM